MQINYAYYGKYEWHAYCIERFMMSQTVNSRPIIVTSVW